ncbi:MAG: RNA polymerase sigma factor [Planctomycetota bacterium]|nr:MAG: RNA polymerase sigma factor [Planctomycetota bacterium]
MAPRVLGALVRQSGDFASAEDAVQEALLAAFVEWPRSGVPDNPGGWLLRVANRRMIDARRGDGARRKRELGVGSSEPRESAVEHDDTLLLLFLCCHPALSEASAIALTLRAVGGLTTAEIARAFLVPEATMAQRISRAKASIESSGVAFEAPNAAERAARLGAVMRVLYLIFNEGYAASGGAALVRVELATESIRLARALHRVAPLDPEVGGLLALLLLTDARRSARTGPAGELVPLDEQDRALWDRAAITEGESVLERALARGAVGPYQIQAAIAALHDAAPSTERTDWPQILALYDLLLRIDGGPMVALSRAIAFAMVHGPRAGLAELELLASDERLAHHHRLAAARAHLLAFAGERDAAIEAFHAAAQRAPSAPERDYLILKAARLASS